MNKREVSSGFVKRKKQRTGDEIGQFSLINTLPNDLVWNNILKQLYPNGSKYIPLVCKSWNKLHESHRRDRWILFKDSRKYGLVTALCYYMKNVYFLENVYVKCHGGHRNPEIIIQPALSMGSTFHFESMYPYKNKQAQLNGKDEYTFPALKLVSHYSDEEKESAFPIEMWMHKKFETDICKGEDISAITTRGVVCDSEYVNIQSSVKDSIKKKFTVDLMTDFPYDMVSLSHNKDNAVSFFGGRIGGEFQRCGSIDLRVSIEIKDTDILNGMKLRGYEPELKCKELRIGGVFNDRDECDVIEFKKELGDVFFGRYKHENLLMWATSGLW